MNILQFARNVEEAVFLSSEKLCGCELVYKPILIRRGGVNTDLKYVRPILIGLLHNSFRYSEPQVNTFRKFTFKKCARRRLKFRLNTHQN
jgi:hypothetical protein